MPKFKILEYGSFLFFVLGAILFLLKYTFFGSILLAVAIVFRSIYVLKMKKVTDTKSEYKDVIDNMEEE